MLTVLLWVADYERMANVVYCRNLFLFYSHVSNVCCTEDRLFYQLIFADKDEQKEIDNLINFVKNSHDKFAIIILRC